MKKERSIDIYSELITGKYINNLVINVKNKYVENVLYQEIEGDIFSYENFYNMIGYDLIKDEEYKYFHLKKQSNLDNDEKEIDKLLLKEYVLSVCLCRYIIDNRKSLSLMFDLEKGLSMEDIRLFLAEERFKKIFITADIGLKVNPIQAILEKKNILVKTGTGNYIAGPIFKKFIDSQSELGEKILYDRGVL